MEWLSLPTLYIVGSTIPYNKTPKNYTTLRGEGYSPASGKVGKSIKFLNGISRKQETPFWKLSYSLNERSSKEDLLSRGWKSSVE